MTGKVKYEENVINNLSLFPVEKNTWTKELDA